MKNFKVLALSSALSFGVMAVPAHAAEVIDSINEDGSFRQATWAATNIGWLYNPTFSYTLTGLATRFRTADGRAVGAAVYSGSPGSLTLLGNGSLTASTAFSQALFGGPVSITSGTQYFFAFSNVAGLGSNVTDDAGATSLGLTYFDFGDATFSQQSNVNPRPMVQFLGVNSAVPEPGTWAMLMLGLFGIGGAMRTARRKQNVSVSYG